MILCCEICGEKIARTAPERLKRPIKASMFDSIESCYPHPFPHNPAVYDPTWEFLVCPICRNRPFQISDDVALAYSKGEPGPAVICVLDKYGHKTAYWLEAPEKNKHLFESELKPPITKELNTKKRGRPRKNGTRKRKQA